MATGNASPLCVLDLTNFNWYIPKVSGNIPSSRNYHKAELIGRFMVITFGNYNNLIEILLFYIIKFIDNYF